MAKLIGASTWEEDLYVHLTTHEQNEGEILTEYKDAAETSPSQAFRYLSALILEDEIRHHRVFRDLASALKTNAELSPEAPAVPHIGTWGDDAASVVSLTETLLERERDDAKELRHLASELKSLKQESLWQLLIKLMEMDTAKHIEILKFVKHHASKSLK
jgi:rubrerythrin